MRQALPVDVVKRRLKTAGHTETTLSQLAEEWGVTRDTARKRLERWTADGLITSTVVRDGPTTIDWVSANVREDVRESEKSLDMADFSMSASVSATLAEPSVSLSASPLLLPPPEPTGREIVPYRPPRTWALSLPPRHPETWTWSGRFWALVAIALGVLASHEQLKIALAYKSATASSSSIAYIFVLANAAIPFMCQHLYDQGNVWLSRGARTFWLGIIVVWCVFANLGHVAMGTSDKEAVRENAALSRDGLIKTLRAAESEREGLPKHPPLAAALAAVAKFQGEQTWTQTRGCTDVTLKTSEKFCNLYAEAKKAEGYAQRAQALEATIQASRDQIGNAPVVADADPQGTLAVRLISRLQVVEPTPEGVRDWRLAVEIFAIEGSAPLFFIMAAALWSRRRKPLMTRENVALS